jgi:hypothetical protein
MKQEKASLISLDNALDDLYVYDRLKVGQHSLLHGLIRIFNRLKYPEYTIISNTELQRKCGIESNHFQRVRESLLKFLIDPNDQESWIVKYQAGDNQSAGKYTFNYSYLNLTTTLPQVYHEFTNTLPQDIPQVYHEFTNTDPKVPKNVNDHRKNRLDQKDKTKKDQTKPDTRVDNLTKDEGEIPKNVFQLVGFSYKGINKEQMQYIVKWYQEGRSDQIVKFYGQAVMDAIEVWRKNDGHQ